MVEIKVDFEGGLENDFSSTKGLKISIPDGMKIRELPFFLKNKFIEQNKNTRFIGDDNNILPGILIMINDVDSEIEGLDVILKNGDNITFISTLHGG